MIKVIVCGDLHFGINNLVFLENQIKFHEDELIPYCLENKISWINFEGDIFDTRKSIDVIVFNKVLDLFKKYEEAKIEIRIIAGNHDIALKSSLSFSSLKILEQFKNIKVYYEITEEQIYDKNFLFIPWQTSLENYVQNITSNDYDHIDVAIAHFDCIGAKFNSYKISDVGLEKNYIMRWPKVYSGHYHSQSHDSNSKSKLTYSGTPYQLTRSDKNETKGFFVLDLDTLEDEFIPNKNSIKFVDVTYPENINFEGINNNIIDLHFTDSDDIDELEKYKEEIWKHNPISVTPKIIPTIKEGEREQIKFKNLRELLDEFVTTLVIKEDIKDDFNIKINELFETHYKEI